MTLTRSLRLALAALAAATATAFALTSTTGDAGARGGCPDGKLCVYKHDELEGKEVRIGQQGVSNKLKRQMNNRASSVENRTDFAASLYEGKDARGDDVCIFPDAHIPQLTAYNFDDRATSTRISNGNACTMRAMRRGTNCPEGKLCLWKDESGGGPRVKIGGNGLSNKLARQMNNKASSVINNRDGRAVLYEKKNGNGENRCIDPSEKLGDLDTIGFDDVASSSRNANGTCAVGPPRLGPGCPEGKLCVWEHNTQGGEVVKIGGSGKSNKLFKKMNNEASSLINNRDEKAFLYDKRNGNGERRCFEPGETVDSLGDTGFNDLASSSRNAVGDICPGGGPPR